MKKIKFAAVGLLLTAAIAFPSLVKSQCNQPQPSDGCLCIYFCTFSLSENACNVTLTWTTETEPSFSSSFKIWRSHDGMNYMLIHNPAGNPGSIQHRSYSYVDASPYNPDQGTIFYYIQMVSNNIVVAQTLIRSAVTSCTGTCPGGTPVMNGFSSPLAVGNTQQLSLTGGNPQPIQWTSSNPNIATVNSNGLLTAVAAGTVTITGRYVVCNTSVSRTLVVPSPNYTLTPNPCGGVFTSTPLNGIAGNVVVLRLNFSGYINWTGISNGTGAVITLTCGGQSSSAATPHYYGSSGFSLSTQITFTMPSNSTTINTIVVVNNSTTMLSSTATLTVVSVNGVPYNNQGYVCGGNSQGSW